MPRFTLTPGQRKLAVEAGAVEASLEAMEEAAGA